jgi:hypothetical protein
MPLRARIVRYCSAMTKNELSRGPALIVMRRRGIDEPDDEHHRDHEKHRDRRERDRQIAPGDLRVIVRKMRPMRATMLHESLIGWSEAACPF